MNMLKKSVGILRLTRSYHPALQNMMTPRQVTGGVFVGCAGKCWVDKYSDLTDRLGIVGWRHKEIPMFEKIRKALLALLEKKTHPKPILVPTPIKSPVVVKPIIYTTPTYTFVPTAMKVRTTQDINVRKDPTTSTSPITLVPKGTVIPVIGSITNGETVGGNSLWYKTTTDQYIWSGNVITEIEEISKKRILHSPLPYLTCTQKFGERPEVYKNYGSPKGHNGLDFRTWVNNDSNNWKQTVFAVLDGVVNQADYDPTFLGNYVRLYHLNGYESVYLHLSKLTVLKGQEVKASELIGISGNTGSVSEAPHLHFGYRPIKCDKSNGYLGYIDPTGLFSEEITYV